MSNYFFKPEFFKFNRIKKGVARANQFELKKHFWND